MEIALAVFVGLIFLATFVVFVAIGVGFYKSFMAVKRKHAKMQKDFDEVWNSTSSTNRYYTPPSRR